jgi:plastocyanin
MREIRGADRGRSLTLAIVIALLAACGGGGSPPAPSPGDNPNQMVVSSSGVLTPSEITIPAGSRVLFINNHSRPHQMASDPHPEHNACPEMDQVGILGPGQRRETGNFVTAKTCGLHDHDDFENDSLKGRIVIR